MERIRQAKIVTNKKMKTEIVHLKNTDLLSSSPYFSPKHVMTVNGLFNTRSKKNMIRNINKTLGINIDYESLMDKHTLVIFEWNRIYWSYKPEPYDKYSGLLTLSNKKLDDTFKTPHPDVFYTPMIINRDNVSNIDCESFKEFGKLILKDKNEELLFRAIDTILFNDAESMQTLASIIEK